MENITFERLYLKTVFCTMASDGSIEDQELQIIKDMCANSPYMKNFDFVTEMNRLVARINAEGKEFIKYYFDLLDRANLNESEELELIIAAIKIIKSDDDIKYSEIRFFKNIRHRLKINDEKILTKLPDIEMFLEKDILSDSLIDKLTSQYLDTVELPAFEIKPIV
jgi:uncharacterized tellurite resistance protein B-like protein